MRFGAMGVTEALMVNVAVLAVAGACGRGFFDARLGSWAVKSLVMAVFLLFAAAIFAYSLRSAALFRAAEAPAASIWRDRAVRQSI